jgi:hypothetical protein
MTTIIAIFGPEQKKLGMNGNWKQMFVGLNSFEGPQVPTYIHITLKANI